jgi:hypothetical protein
MTAKSTTPAALTWSGVTARRMARHSLTEPATDLGPADIAGALCGAHAQVLSAAELSIGRRIAGATSACVQRAVAGAHAGQDELVGAVMEATPTLSVGTVTVGPHA